MLAQTQCDGQFFMVQVRIIRREIGGEIALIVAGTTAIRSSLQPLIWQTLRNKGETWTVSPSRLARGRTA